MIRLRWLVISVSVGWLSAGTADARDRRSDGTIEGSRKADVRQRESTGLHGRVGPSAGAPLAAGGRIRWRFPMDSWLGGWFVTVAPDGTVYASDLSKLYALTANGDLLWAASLAGGRRPISVGADGTVYAAGNLIKAFNPDGTLKWQFVDPFGMGLLAGPNVGPDGNIYAVQDSNIGGGGGLGAFSLDPGGNLLWADEGDAGTASTEGSNSAIVFGTDRFFVGINATNNTPTLWSFGLDGNPLWNAGSSDLNLPAFTFPKLDPAGRIISRWFGTGMMAITPNGAVDWVSIHPGGGSPTMPGIDSNGLIYTGTYLGRKLWAINPNGSTRWVLPSSGGLTDTVNVAPDGSIILVGGSDTFGQPGWAQAYNTADGTFLWQVDLVSEGGINQYVCSQQPTFTPDSQTAYFTTCFLGDVGHSYVYAIDTSGAPGGCLTDTDCDDSNPCTDDACDPVLGCQFVNNSAPCNDFFACTTNDVCSNGICDGTPIVCDDGSACTDDSCHPVLGCQFVNNTDPCDDGDPCTSGDVCSAGACVGGSPVDCNDGSPCTDDSCDALFGCQHVNNTDPCDDGDPCTSGDACLSGVCVGGSLLDCDDGNPCTDDSCDALFGCQHVDNTDFCDDDDACTTNDACSGGACVGGAPLDCTDGDPCTEDLCDPLSGCQYANNANPCDDGNACTTNDVCGSGSCHGEPVNCDDGVACTTDSCDETTGLCKHDPDDAFCDNGQFCDGVETCDPLLDCRAGDEPCPPTECDETADGCTSCQAAADCDDGNPCTFDRCGDVCLRTRALYGDISGAQGACGPDSLVDLSDILSVLDGFQGIFAGGCDEYNIDIAGPGGSCSGDGGIDLADILAVLDSFAGISECAVNCAAGGPAVLPRPSRRLADPRRLGDPGRLPTQGHPAHGSRLAAPLLNSRRK